MGVRRDVWGQATAARLGYLLEHSLKCVWLCVVMCVCVCVCVLRGCVDHDLILTQEAHKGAVDPINCMCGAVSWKATKGSVVSVTSAIQCTVCQQLHHSQCIDYEPKEGDSFVCINCLLEKVSCLEQGLGLSLFCKVCTVSLYTRPVQLVVKQEQNCHCK